jgi:hypothetical protein
VTEQDVVNEEMYEEEDDDMPNQYRRISQHLQTSSMDFNKRLEAYLAGHMAVRQGMAGFMNNNNNYGQPFNNPAAYQYNQGMTFASPQYQSQMATPQMQHAPPPMGTYRQAPYSIPTAQQRQNLHARSHSIATPEMSRIEQLSPLSSEQKPRPASFAVPQSYDTPPHTSPTTQTIKAEAPQQLDLVTVSPNTSGTAPSPSQQFQQPSPAHSESSPAPHPQPTPQLQTRPLPTTRQQALSNMDMNYMSPLSMALPTESQMMLGPSLDPRDPMTNLFMGGNQFINPTLYYNYGNGMPSASMPSTKADFSTYGDMTTTLAPSDLDLSSFGNDFTNSSMVPASNFFDEGMKLTAGGSGFDTPGNNSFNQFIDLDQFLDTAPSSQV